jgi:hypothetical protein
MPPVFCLGRDLMDAQSPGDGLERAWEATLEFRNARRRQQGTQKSLHLSRIGGGARNGGLQAVVEAEWRLSGALIYACSLEVYVRTCLEKHWPSVHLRPTAQDATQAKGERQDTAVGTAPGKT